MPPILRSEKNSAARVLSIDRNVGKGFAVTTVLPLLSTTQLRRRGIDAACAAAKHGIELSRSMGYRHGEATNLILAAQAEARIAS